MTAPILRASGLLGSHRSLISSPRRKAVWAVCVTGQDKNRVSVMVINAEPSFRAIRSTGRWLQAEVAYHPGSYPDALEQIDEVILDAIKVIGAEFGNRRTISWVFGLISKIPGYEIGPKWNGALKELVVEKSSNLLRI